MSARKVIPVGVEKAQLKKFTPKSKLTDVHKHRLAKCHDFVVCLTISRPISRSHELATDFSCFLEKSNSNGGRVWLHSSSLPLLAAATKCEAVSPNMAANKTWKLQNPTRKIDL